MSSVRLEKIAALVRKELSIVFQQNMQALFQGTMITVTRVRISPDLGVAKVYLSFFPSERAEAGIGHVKEQGTTIRRMLAEAIGKQVRKIPELQFYVDDSLDYLDEINRLLKK